MFSNNNILTGGEGSCLHPLAAERRKPAMPFNGRHRIMGFVLSNLTHSGIFSIYLLMQHKSQPLKSQPLIEPLPGEPKRHRGGAEWPLPARRGALKAGGIARVG